MSTQKLHDRFIIMWLRKWNRLAGEFLLADENKQEIMEIVALRVVSLQDAEWASCSGLYPR